MGYISDLRRLVGHRPLIMPCACVIIGDGQGRVLLQQRVDDGKWGYHGGAVELDESVEDALRREVREELNLELEGLELFGIYSGPEYHHVYPNGDETSCIDIVYTCHRTRGALRLQPEEVARVAWFDRETLPDDLTDSSRRAIHEYLARF